ncbi:hypothetical protein QCA50_018369 [Cerrena zonata]|uniref:Uncharacterized protein n=1 Tax=Cerrena zonata TaxID=2478898 RepID=A0AAW0FMY1_9APHY
MAATPQASTTKLNGINTTSNNTSSYLSNGAKPSAPLTTPNGTQAIPPQLGGPRPLIAPPLNQNLTNYQHSTFFEQQLTAFEIWLKYAGPSTKDAPEQLPIVLQVLLSQVHRLRALILLSKFLDLAQELKPVLIFIWARIMAIDYKSTQQELCKDKGYNYFYLIFNSNPSNQIGAPGAPGSISGSNAANILINDDHKAMKVRTSIILAMTNFLSDPSDPQAQPQGQGQGQPQQQPQRTQSSNINAELRKDELKQQDLKLANVILSLLGDGSSMVYTKFFLVVAFNQLEEEIVLIDNANYLHEFRKNSPAYCSIFSSIWKALLILSEDPHLEVKQLAETLIDFIMLKLNQSELSPLVKEMQDYLLSKSTITIGENFKQPIINRPLGNIRNGTEPTKRQVSGGAVMNRKNNLLIDGTSMKTRSASTNNLNALYQKQLNGRGNEDNSDAESISSKIKNMSISKLFKSFQINEEHDLKNFTRILQSGPTPSTYGAEFKPKTPRFVPRDLTADIELKDESGFFEYSCEYFQEPQMSKNEIDEPGSKEYIKRLWRRNRNEQIIQETQPQKKLAVRGDWNRNAPITLNNKSQPKLIKFTQFEKILVASDEKDTVSVWDWEVGKIVKKFSNGNPFGSKITDMKFLNEDDLPLLLTGSSDGVIKIYKKFHTENEEGEEEKNCELIASWRALTDLLLTSKSSGLISEWQQSRGSLLVSGDVKIIRVWDAPRELCLVDIPARSTSSITSLTSDQVAGNIFVAGFDDGSLRVYDRRMDSRDSMVKAWPKSRATYLSSNPVLKASIGRGSIRNIHMQRGGFRELVSGSSDGFINLWDVRLDEPVVSFDNSPEKSIRSIDVHEHAPIITTGSKNVNIWTTSGDLISTLRKPHENYLSNRTSNYLSSTSFHPHRMMVATNYNQDSSINVYNCSDIILEYLQ